MMSASTSASTSILDQAPEFYINTYDPWSLHDDNDNENDNDSNNNNDDDDGSFSLPWGQINILVVTDVHSWIAGNHRDDPRQWPLDVRRPFSQDADYGDVLSFYERLREIVGEHNDCNCNDNDNDNDNETKRRDLFFVMNGDFVDGTGLSGVPPVHLAPLLEHMPWDAINVGNHELYSDETVRYLVGGNDTSSSSTSTTTTNNNNPWKTKYLASNTLLTSTMQPMTGKRYAYLEGPNTRTTILTLGFLFDFHHNGPATTVVDVEDALEEDWLADVLKGGGDNGGDHDGDNRYRNFDAILVLAHMDCLDPLVRKLLEGIRGLLPAGRETLPIQFLTGHTHRRCRSRLDPFAESLEAGRFLDTIGFVSFDAPSSTSSVVSSSSSSTEQQRDRDRYRFQHRFLDANRETLRRTLVDSSSSSSSVSVASERFANGFGTPRGKALTAAIRNTRSDLGLDATVGCSPRTYGLFDDRYHHHREDIREAGAPPRTASPLPSSSTSPSPLDPNSLWGLFVREVLPKQFLAHYATATITSSATATHSASASAPVPEPIFLAGTGVLRYSLFAGPVTVNDIVAISPFNDTLLELYAERESESESEENDTEDSAAAASAAASDAFVWRGWELQRLLTASNRGPVGDYGLPHFVASILPKQTQHQPQTRDSTTTGTNTTSTGEQPSAIVIDPDQTYRLFSTDFDSYRLLSVLETLDLDSDPDLTHPEPAGEEAHPRRRQRRRVRSYRTKRACRDDESQTGCDYLTNLWHDYVSERMPCVDGNGNGNGNLDNNLDNNLDDDQWKGLRLPSESSNDKTGDGDSDGTISDNNNNNNNNNAWVVVDAYSFDARLSQLVTPFWSTAMAETPSDETTMVPTATRASDQWAAAFLVVLALAAIVVLMVFPPRGSGEEPRDRGRGQRRRQRQRRYLGRRAAFPNSHASRLSPSSSSSSSSNSSSSSSNEEWPSDVQLMPLRRMDTGSSGSSSSRSSTSSSFYGSI